MNNDWIDIPYRAEKEHAGLRLDSFLALKMKGRSRAAIQRLIIGGKVSLASHSGDESIDDRKDDVRHSFARKRPGIGNAGVDPWPVKILPDHPKIAPKPAARLRAGDTVLVRFPRRIDPPALFDRLPILFEDDHLLAIDKPARLLSHPTDRVRQNSVTEILRRQTKAGSLFLVHRLDRETSGVLLLAKSREAARILTEAFTKRGVRKEYLAAVRGRISWLRKTLDAPLGYAGGDIKVRQTVDPEGSKAITEFICLGHGERWSIVKALPRTGRLHQIRAHLAALGHPLLGDKLYQGEGEAYLKAVKGSIDEDDLATLGAPRQMLHARRLSFAHPVSGEPIAIAAPLPSDFPSVLAFGHGRPAAAECRDRRPISEDGMSIRQRPELRATERRADPAREEAPMTPP